MFNWLKEKYRFKEISASELLFLTILSQKRNSHNLRLIAILLLFLNIIIDEILQRYLDTSERKKIAEG